MRVNILRVLGFSLVLFAPVAPSWAVVTTVDDTGAQVTLSRPATRVISLAPHTTEMLFAVGAGDRVVGVVDYSDYPPEAAQLANVGSSSRLDFERIVSLKPDLIVIWADGTPSAAQAKLRQLGFPIYVSEPRTLEKIALNMERLARLSATEQVGDEAAKRLREGMAALEARYSKRPTVSVFYQIWDRPMTTIAGDQLLGKVITLCGGRNVFGRLKSVAPQVDVEAVLAADPDVITTAGGPLYSPLWITSWQRWTQLKAVRTKNVVSVNADLTQRQGPRILLGAMELCEALDRARGQNEK